MFKVSKIAAGLAIVPLLAFAAPVLADSPGDLAGGADIYQVRNTKSTTYSNSATVTCDESVKYSVKLSNTDFGKITNITVKAPLSGKMTASGTNSAGATTSTEGTVTVTTTKGTLSYVSNTTELIASDGTKIKDLPDGVTAGGINVGDLNGSTREFVQFQAKVKCETPPKECKPGIPEGDKRCETTPPKECKPGIPMGDKRCETTPPKKEECKPGVPMGDKKCKEEVLSTTTTNTTPPTELPHTGAGNIAFIVAGAAAVAGLAHRAVSFRRQSR